MRNPLQNNWLLSTGWVVSSGAVFAISSSASAASATLSISTSLGNNRLLANTAGQKIDLNIANGNTLISGTDVLVQINNGSVSGTEPVLTNVVVAGSGSGTLFASEPAGSAEFNGDWQAGNGTSIFPSTVADSGVLGVITVNTTGLSAGSTFTIQFANIDGNSTDVDDSSNNSNTITLAGDGTTLSGSNIQGTISLVAVPEPGTADLLSAGLGGVLTRRRRRV